VVEVLLIIRDMSRTEASPCPAHRQHMCAAMTLDRPIIVPRKPAAIEGDSRYIPSRSGALPQGRRDLPQVFDHGLYRGTFPGCTD
jgi:hypothetical protein